MGDQSRRKRGETTSSSQAYFGEGDRKGDSRIEQFQHETGMLFEKAMAQTRMAMCLTDPNQDDDPIVFCNRAFERLTGYGTDEIIGRNCRFLQGSKTDPDQVAKIREALETETLGVVEILNYRKDGSTFWNTLHVGPIYDDEGRLRYFFGSQWDVTDVHQARIEERHAKAMAREVSHRLKNVFSVIGGIVNITGRTMDAAPVAKSINERIQALGRAYEPTLDEAFMGTIQLSQAIRSVLAPYDPEGNRISYDGNGIRTEPNVISVIGLTLHELATNATKYGALSNNDGQVQVSWQYDSDKHDRQSLVIDWKEIGGPRIEKEPKGSGTGLGIADTLLSYSNGVLEREWKPDGLHATIAMPMGK